MKLNYVIVYVDDAVKAAGFYREAFGLTVKFVHESKMYAEMESGETTLAFANGEMLKMNAGIDPAKGAGSRFEIAFSTGDVAAAFEHAVSRGAMEIKKPEVKPWGQTVAYVRDPYGTLIEICTPME